MGSDVLLFDCGEGTQRQFMSSSVSYMKVTDVFITHLHGDHFLGLPAMMQSMNFGGRTKDLRVHGPPGTVGAVRAMLGLGYFTPGYGIYARDLEEDEAVAFPGFRVTAFPVDHTVPAYGYVLEEDPRPGRFNLERAKELGVPEGPAFRRLQAGETVEVGGRPVIPDQVLGPKRRGRKLVISGDTRPCERLVRAALGADLLIHESTLHSTLKKEAMEYGHSTSRDAAEVARAADARMLYLYHFSNRYEDAGPLLEEARGIFPATYLAEDLASVQVNPPEEEWNRQAR
jgi:ribonuclease Z